MRPVRVHALEPASLPDDRVEIGARVEWPQTLVGSRTESLVPSPLPDDR